VSLVVVDDPHNMAGSARASSRRRWRPRGAQGAWGHDRGRFTPPTPPTLATSSWWRSPTSSTSSSRRSSTRWRS